MNIHFNILFLVMALPVMGQTSEADAYLQSGDFDKAAEAYKVYLSTHPNDSLVAYKRGRTYAGLHEWTLSASYYEQALQGQFPPGIIYYQQARNALMQKRSSTAMEYLRRGAEAGMRNYIALRHDPLFEPLYQEKEWQQLLDKVELNTYPCLSKEEYRKFDFWLGSWDVFRNGNKIGENRITRANGGCAIHEDYTTYPRDYTGQSINFYDPLEQRWHQHWVGSGGDVTNYFESDSGEGMIQFIGKTLGRSGAMLNRMTFTLKDDGNVRQHIESSTDEGQSWSTSFDGLYVKQH